MHDLLKYIKLVLFLSVWHILLSSWLQQLKEEYYTNGIYYLALFTKVACFLCFSLFSCNYVKGQRICRKKAHSHCQMLFKNHNSPEKYPKNIVMGPPSNIAQTKLTFLFLHMTIGPRQCARKSIVDEQERVRHNYCVIGTKEHRDGNHAIPVICDFNVSPKIKVYNCCEHFFGHFSPSPRKVTSFLDGPRLPLCITYWSWLMLSEGSHRLSAFLSYLAPKSVCRRILSTDAFQCMILSRGDQLEWKFRSENKKSGSILQKLQWQKWQTCKRNGFCHNIFVHVFCEHIYFIHCHIL